MKTENIERTEVEGELAVLKSAKYPAGRCLSMVLVTRDAAKGWTRSDEIKVWEDAVGPAKFAEAASLTAGDRVRVTGIRHETQAAAPRGTATFRHVVAFGIDFPEDGR